jgi:hypothetical protein
MGRVEEWWRNLSTAIASRRIGPLDLLHEKFGYRHRRIVLWTGVSACKALSRGLQWPAFGPGHILQNAGHRTLPTASDDATAP